MFFREITERKRYKRLKIHADEDLLLLLNLDSIDGWHAQWTSRSDRVRWQWRWRRRRRSAEQIEQYNQNDPCIEKILTHTEMCPMPKSRRCFVSESNDLSAWNQFIVLRRRPGSQEVLPMARLFVSQLSARGGTATDYGCTSRSAQVTFLSAIVLQLVEFDHVQTTGNDQSTENRFGNESKSIPQFHVILGTETFGHTEESTTTAGEFVDTKSRQKWVVSFFDSMDEANLLPSSQIIELIITKMKITKWTVASRWCPCWTIGYGSVGVSLIKSWTIFRPFHRMSKVYGRAALSAWSIWLHIDQRIRRNGRTSPSPRSSDNLNLLRTIDRRTWSMDCEI